VFLYQYILLAGFVCLLSRRNTKLAAATFLTAWAVYILITLDASATFYYGAAATIELTVAYLLNKRYRVVSWLGYSLILVNIYGLILYRNGIGPITYDVIYAIISVTQFLFLLVRVAPNGLNRLHPQHFVVRAVNFDSRGAYDRMYKNTQKKGSNR
jgi:hypothetical protein